MAIVTSSADSVPSPPPAACSWQQALARAVRDPQQLCDLLNLPEPFRAQAAQAARHFPLVAPREYIARMQPGNPRDPLLRQVLPVGEELADMPDYVTDPVGDAPASVQPGLLQKYAGRALILTTPTCAVHCRYCFRRHFNYQAAPRTLEAWQPAWEALARDPSIHEIVLSGGDPLTLPDERLAALVARIAALDHVRHLRLHTRLPVVIPQRVTDRLVALLKSTRLTTLCVIHANHPAELDATVVRAVARLVDAGIPVLNQSVLLRGVNDDLEVLVELSHCLVAARVMPYYLHQLDQVAGAAHFRVPVSLGRRLVRQMRRRLPGYAVPRYVRELPGRPSKTLLA